MWAPLTRLMRTLGPPAVAARRRFARTSLFGSVLLAVGAGAFVAVAVTFAIGVALGTNPRAAHPAGIDVLKTALSVVAGVGGAVALVVAYRRQRDLEQGRFVERFGAAAAQLGDKDVAVRIAGAYAMAGVADEAATFQQRQQSIDVLCGYLRLPYSTALGANHRTVTTMSGTRTTDGQVTEHRHEFRQNDKQVRQTIVRIIADHLHDTAGKPWCSHDFDFRGAVLENCHDFSNAGFLAVARFDGANFKGDARFDGATFEQEACFGDATFTGAASFFAVKFNGAADFDRARIGGEAMFGGAAFSSAATFRQAIFNGDAWFGESVMTAATTSPAIFSSAPVFSGATFRRNAFFGGVKDVYFGESWDPRDNTKLLPAATFEKRDLIASLSPPEDASHEYGPSTDPGGCPISTAPQPSRDPGDQP